MEPGVYSFKHNCSKRLGSMRVWYVLGLHTKWFLSSALYKVTVKAEENTCRSALHTSALPSACSPAHAHTHLTPSYLPGL